ncbi:MAG: phosphoglycerate dehydrogenase, partial [Actinobacteria bacterium]|nr:phosphoglycerate dehydrogenase [Actinomycetota bacterium]
GDYEAIVTRSETKVTAEVIAAAPKLKVVGRAGVGVDNIDVQAATEKGILVVNVPGANTVAAAEHALALILALARHVPQACDDLKGGNWKRSKFAGVELRGKTLGIIGLGRIGTEVANRARAFEMRILAYDPYVTPARAEKIGAEVVPLEALLRESDFVSLHTAKTQETTGLLGPEEIAAMKEGARLINCARGGLVDEDALYSALKEGKLAGAALDVFAQEPPGKHPLFELPNVIAAPHL